MPLDKRLLGQLRRLDRHDLRRILIFVRGLLLALGDAEAAAPEASGDPAGKVTYRREMVRCGKPGCEKCPHGPYWYAYYREDGKQRSRYVGRDLPDDVKAALNEPG